MNIRLLTLLLLLLFTFSSCEKDKELTLSIQPYYGNELRLDGYYYYLNDSMGMVFDTYFFYQNGVCIYGNSFHQEEVFEYMNYIFLSDFFLNNMTKDNYGAFVIQDDSIVIEKWALTQGPKPVSRYTGRILNDTTFIINQYRNPYTDEREQLNNLFHFHAFSPKPDSTNTYVP